LAGSPSKKTLNIGIALLALVAVVGAASWIASAAQTAEITRLTGADPQARSEWLAATTGPTAAEIVSVGIERGRILNGLYGLNAPTAADGVAIYMGVNGLAAPVPGGAVGNVTGLPEMMDLPGVTLPPVYRAQFEDGKYQPR